MFSLQFKRRITQRTQFLFLCIGLLSLLMTQPLLAKSHDDMQIAKADVLELGTLTLNTESGMSEMKVTTEQRELTLQLTENQSLVENLPAITDDTEFTLYKGSIVGRDNSWVRLTMINNHLSGAFFDGDDLHFIDLLSEVRGNLTDPDIAENQFFAVDTMVVYKASEVKHDGVCALDEGNSNDFLGIDYQAFVDELADITAASASQQLQVAVIADTQFDAAEGGNGAASMLAEMNIVDGIFSEQLDLQMTVAETRVLTNNANLTSSSASTLIDQLRSYANTEITNPGLVHLFTGRDLNGSTVGIAYIGAACSSFGTGITQRRGSVTALIAAHEFGHNLGAPHDNQGGSACSNTPGTFLMNPSINGSDQFSSCSRGIINNFVGRANCITPNDNVAPTITSTPNLSATVGVDYQYDGNGRLEANGSGNVTFTLDFGPQGMAVSNDGTVSWVPTAGQLGSQSVQITANNSSGSDSQSFDVVVEQSSTTGIDFNNTNNTAYGSNQDGAGNVDVVSNGAGIRLQGNRWRSIPFNYTVTRDTVLEFDFSSNSQGEIHGIGLDNNSSISSGRTFSVYGSQNWGIQNFRYDGSGSVQRFSIPVGQFYSGQVANLFFIMDHDVASPSGQSVFSNVRVFESTTSTVALNFNDFTQSEYASGQDGQGTVETLSNGTTLKLTGNRWRSINISGVITPDTVLEFDFKSNIEGEVHAIGLDNNGIMSANRAFKLYGTQRWGIGNFSYTGRGATQQIVIPVGQFYTGSFDRMFFIMDQDVGGVNAESEFSNVVLR